MSRIVGLSRSNGPQKSLLKSIPGRAQPDDTQLEDTHGQNSSLRSCIGDMEDFDFDKATPPEASSDEEETADLSSNVAPNVRTTGKEESISDSDDDRSRRNDIKRTKFVGLEQKQLKRGAGESQWSNDSAKYAQKNSGLSAGNHMKELTSSLKSADTPSSSHLVTKHGFIPPQLKSRVLRPNNKMARRLNAGYGAKDKARDMKKRSIKEPDNGSPPKPGFKVPKMESSPEPTSPKPTLKRSAQVLESPEVSPKKEFLRGPPRMCKDIDRDSPEPPQLWLPELTSTDNYASIQSSASQDFDSATLPSLRYPLGQSGSDNVLSQVDVADDVLGIFDESTRSRYLVDEDDELSEAENTKNIAKCPMCHASVDPALLKKHTGVDRMSIRQQTDFCRLHQRKEASSTTTYPKVNWSRVELRLEGHREFLEKILEGQRPSHYADKYQDKLKDKAQRTLFKSGDALTPGYYGPLGLRVMTEFIVRDLGDVLRRRAVEDMLVSARGHTRYVQSVLVPELAVRLIMEDMEVSAKKARAVLEESKAVGELLNEDDGDFVMDVVSENDDHNDNDEDE
ncbi:RTC4-like domain-containing protein [Microdochium nivale]|nr:RTC4-like domain-containing protein [Microdochium nivale]